MDMIPKLDERLSAVYDLFPACDLGADIGADHGRLSCKLLSSGKVKKMLVTDISTESLKKADTLLKTHGLRDRAELLVGDGLEILNTTCGGIAICGMGGEVMSGILSGGALRLHGAELILCPQTDISTVRSTVMRLGYHFQDETAVCAADRYYIVMKAVQGKAVYTSRELFLGPVLCHRTDALTKKYYQWRLAVEAKIKNNSTEEKTGWLKELCE